MTDGLPDVHPDDVLPPPRGYEATVAQIERRTALSENQAKVFFLADVLGRPESEVAALLGMTIGTVRSHKGRVRSKTRKARQLVEYVDQNR